ncbi:MAG: prepilin-type N-terminal cleavage/methylation domain-containing protein [Tepidisphaeraceae bacterium]
MQRKSSAFSLVELLVALAILAAMTTVALRSVNGLQSQARYQQTTRALDEIRNAIIGPPNLRGPDGSAMVSGFVADTGRLPNFLVSASDASVPGDGLNELLQQNGIPAFAFVQSNGDPTVLIGVGWKGPYLRLGAGPSFIRDGWGNSFHCYDTSGALIGANGTPIAQIASWGADNLPDTNHGGSGDLTGYNADISIPNPSGLTSGGFVTSASFYGRVTMNVGTDASSNTTGPAPNPTYTPPSSSKVTVSVWVCYYGPDLTQTPRPVTGIPVLVSDTVNWSYVLANTRISIGPRVLKAYVVDSSRVNSANFANQVALPPNSTTGPVYFTSTLNVTATGGSQTVPDLVLPHYNP